MNSESVEEGFGITVRLNRPLKYQRAGCLEGKVHVPINCHGLVEPIPSILCVNPNRHSIQRIVDLRRRHHAVQ